MAPFCDISSELSKLKKEYLVEIIITKQIPSGVTTSLDLQKFIEGNESEVNLLTLEIELKAAKMEITYLKRMMENLEET
ncbi:hypothetical protein HHI36_010705, partial [Cryptolaemus montrouzieri]